MSDMRPPGKPDAYTSILEEIMARIQHARPRAVLAVNAELCRPYWGVGRVRDARHAQEGYGTAVIPRLAKALKNELPELKKLFERNSGYSFAFTIARPVPTTEPSVHPAKPSRKQPGGRA